MRPLARSSLFNPYDLFARIQKTEEFWFGFANLLQVGIRCMMFGHKRLGALVTLSREEKAGNFMLKTGKEKLVRKDISGLACVGKSRKT